MPLDELVSGDQFDVVKNKVNAAIEALNKFIGGDTDQVFAKINSTDFNFSARNSVLPASGTANIKIIVIDIGDWNMDDDTYKTITYPVSIDKTKVRMIQAMIRGDIGTGRTSLVPLDCAHINSGGDCYFESTDTEPAGGVDYATACDTLGGIVLYRKPSGLFDSTNYNSTSYNRGFVTIMYEG